MVVSIIRERPLLGCASFISNWMEESRWGLGLQYLSDMPGENVINFGIVSLVQSI
jgi:hypothetical protein